MTRTFEEYKTTVETQVEELLGLLADIGLGENYDLTVTMPADDTPLAELYAAVQIVADNLNLVTNELKEKTTEAQRYAETVKQQSDAIFELSTPVIEILDDVLVVPLVGTIDSARADQVVEQLLVSISRHHASVAILDITGVPIVDTRVAAHLTKTMTAAKLIGAECVLTGVSPQIAETMVRVGVDVTELKTLGSLQAGVEYALAKTRRKIVHREEKRQGEKP